MGGLNQNLIDTSLLNGPAPATSGVGVSLQQLLRSSFRCIGQLRPGFGYSPSELIDALFILNAMLDSWAADDINAYCTLIQSFPLVFGKQTYTLGPGGEFSGQRPTNITKATLVVLTNPAQPLRLDISACDADAWQLINVQQTASTLARRYFYNPTFGDSGLGQISFWPVPNEGDNVELSSSGLIAGPFTGETQILSAPPGYLDAVRYQLAIRLAMEWDKPLKDGVVALASESLARIQRLNEDTPQMTCNPGVLPIRSSRGGFNRLLGE